MSMYETGRWGWQSPKSWDGVRQGQKARVRWSAEALPDDKGKKLEAMPWKEGVIGDGDRSIVVAGVMLPLPPLKAFEIYGEVK